MVSHLAVPFGNRELMSLSKTGPRTSTPETFAGARRQRKTRRKPEGSVRGAHYVSLSGYSAEYRRNRRKNQAKIPRRFRCSSPDCPATRALAARFARGIDRPAPAWLRVCMRCRAWKAANAAHSIASYCAMAWRKTSLSALSKLPSWRMAKANHNGTAKT